MDVIKLLVLLALIGLACWVLVALVPMPAPFGTILVVVAALACILLVARRL